MLYVLGYPADCGGANVELFATVKLWRAHGVPVTLIPTWSAPLVWREQLDELGCETFITSNKQIELPDDSTVVSFGNYHLLDVTGRLKNCRLIYVPCTSTPTKGDVKFHKSGEEFNEYIFQSNYQYLQYVLPFGLPESKCHLIPGAFDPSEFPFIPLPHKLGEPFWAGRISRPDKLKFSPQLWDAYRPVPNIRAWIMGWSNTIENHCGGVPEWATVLKKRSESAQEFYSHLHAIIHPSGQISENWPRFVLEAMALGVPVITDNRGGVCEMIEHDETGFLCNSPERMAEIATWMTRHETQRLEIAVEARKAVEEMSNPEPIWDKWKPLLKGC